MGKLRIAHYVTFDKKFIPQQIPFLNQHFAEELEQTFYVHGATDSYLASAPENVVSLNKSNFIQFVMAAHKADRLIFNGLFYWKVILIFSSMPWVLRKAIWLPWGGDLYWRLYGEESVKRELFLAVKGWFVRHLYAIATPTYGDYETAIKWYGKGPRYLNAGCNIFNFEKADLDRLIEQKEYGPTCRIQIGNSGDPANDHLGAMELLSRFASENIQVYVPLSYGDEVYAEEVIEKGKQLFGGKFTPLTQFMAPDEYNRHLASVDVLVLNHRRQQGFGNSVISMYLGAKIFIRGDVSTWAYLSEDMKCSVSDTRKIGGMGFHQFSENTAETVKKNRLAVAHLFDRKWQKFSWSKLYSD